MENKFFKMCFYNECRRQTCGSQILYSEDTPLNPPGEHIYTLIYMCVHVCVYCIPNTTSFSRLDPTLHNIINYVYTLQIQTYVCIDVYHDLLLFLQQKNHNQLSLMPRYI